MKYAKYLELEIVFNRRRLHTILILLELFKKRADPTLSAFSNEYRARVIERIGLAIFFLKSNNSIAGVLFFEFGEIDPTFSFSYFCGVYARRLRSKIKTDLESLYSGEFVVGRYQAILP